MIDSGWSISAIFRDYLEQHFINKGTVPVSDNHKVESLD